MFLLCLHYSARLEKGTKPPSENRGRVSRRVRGEAQRGLRAARQQEERRIEMLPKSVAGRAQLQAPRLTVCERITAAGEGGQGAQSHPGQLFKRQ